MAEAVGLFASCVTIVNVCNSLYEAVKRTREQHATIQLLRKEVKALVKIVEKIQSFGDEWMLKGMEATQSNHWKDVKQVLEDCHTTAKNLNRLIATPNTSRNALSRAWHAGKDTAKTKWNYAAISLLQRELRMHRDTLSISMQVIQLYV